MDQALNNELFKEREEEDLVKKGILMRQRLQAKMKKNMIIKKMPGVSQLAQAMRFIICQFMKRQIESGFIKSKFFSQFIICDIISPKCFVVLPKNNIALTVDGKARKLIFKLLNSDEIQAGSGISNPTDKQISGMIDDWIYMAPQSRNIAKAYEVFKDYMFYMQLTEYCEEYDNIYNTLKLMNIGSLQENLPRELIRFTYLYVIQVSHAFMNAHKSGLCHGDFNLTQVICDRNRESFKMINFRPWLISKLQQKSSFDDEPIFTKQELLKIARARDLYQFGESIFDMMVGKTSKEVIVKQVIVEQKNMQTVSLQSTYSSQLKKEKLKINMPPLESIPLIWVKQVESTCLLEIIHMCMVIDVNRDTVDLFTHIHNIASYQYARFFDASFKPFKNIRETNDAVKNRDFAIGLNNRSVMTRFKILQHGLNRVVSEHENQQVLNFQEKLLQQACKMAYHCDESQLNLCLLQWQRGQLLDDDFCKQINLRITENLTAQYICLMFRRAIGLSINRMEEKQILPLTPMDPVGILISDQYKEFSQLKMQNSANFEVHIGSLINQGKKEFVASSDVKKIFFSENEKFCILVTANVVVVLQIQSNSFKVLGQVILPNCMPLQSPRKKQIGLPESPKTKVVSSRSNSKTPRFDIPASPVGSEEQSAFQSVQSVITDPLSSGLMSPKASERDAKLPSTEEREKEEKRLLQLQIEENRKKQVLCNGYFSSPWVAAIDNKGKILVLHQMDQTKLVQRTRADDDLDQFAQKSKLILTCDNEIKRIYPGMKLTSELHLFTGDQFTDNKVLQIGRLCPDEVLDITFQDEQESKRVSEDFEDVYNQLSPKTQVLGEDNESDQGLLNTNPLSSRATLQLEHQGTAEFNMVSKDPPASPTLNMKSKTSFPGFSQEPSIVGLHLKTPNNLTQNSQFSFASNREQPPTIKVKCKNLLQYTINLDQLILTNKPDQMEGGAAIPVSIFNNPNGTKKEKITMAKYEKIKNTASLLFQKHSLSDPSYKSKHYDHLKQFIQKQEFVGNIIKFAKNNNQYLIGYQQREYKSRKPHYFVYDILMRKVVRRFAPISSWFSLQENNNNEEGQDSKAFLRNSMTILKEKNPDNSATETPFKSIEEEESVVSEVLNFEVSPNGNFMVQVVEPQLIGLRFLNPGILEVFRDNLQPGYFTQEDSLQIFSDVQQELSGLAGNLEAPKRDQKELKQEPVDFGHNNYSKKQIQDFYRSSIRFSIKQPISQDQLDQLVDPFAKYRQIDESRPLSNQLILAHQNYENYMGSTYQKHLKFIQFHTLVAKCLSSPESLINPGAIKVFSTFATDPDQETPVSPLSNLSKSPNFLEELDPIKKEITKLLDNYRHEKMIEEEKENAATTIPGGIISARILKKCFFAIQEFHFNYSVMTSMNNMSGSHTNFFSQKVGINSLRKFTTFDQIAFRHNSDKIKQFKMCSNPRNWMFVVYYSRVLQIFDQITGAQIFELSVPSAKSFAMIDNEQLIVVQDGISSVWIATIECQKKAFISKGTAQRKVDAHLVIEYEENQKISEYELGLAHQRQRIKRKTDEDRSESNEEEEGDYGGIKLFKWDQEILELVTAGSTSLFGYFALIGKTKVSLFNAYADEESCVYDHLWTINFIDFRNLNIGLSIKKLDIAANCESFCCYTNTGIICIWNIKTQKMEQKVYVVRTADRPIVRIKSVNNNQTIVAYSRQSSLIMVINALGIQNMKEGSVEDYVLRISPGSDGFGDVVNLQVDNSEQFLICAFTRNKLGVYGMKNGQLLMTVEDSALICEDSFIDETGCYMAAMDVSRKFVNIYTFDWNYKIQLPTPPKPKKDKQAEELELKRNQEEEKAKELEKKKEDEKKKTKSCIIF